MSSLVEFKKVYFKYKNSEEWVLENLNLSFNEGDRIGIVGDNGSGKSTISKLILGIEKPNKGEIHYNGEEVKWNKHYPHLGYIGDPSHSEELQGLPNNLIVGDLVSIINQIYAKTGMGIKRDKLYQLLQIENLLAKKTQNLSTGERKRVMTYMALSKPNKLVILDEPFDGLDENIKTKLFELLHEYLKPETSVLYIAHNRIEIDLYTDKVYKIKNKRLEQEAQKKFEVTTSIDESIVNRKVEKLGELQYNLNKLLDSKKNENIKLDICPLIQSKEENAKN